MKKLASQILFQDDLNDLAEEITARMERKLSLSGPMVNDLFDIIWDELTDLFPDLKYKSVN